MADQTDCCYADVAVTSSISAWDVATLCAVALLAGGDSLSLGLTPYRMNDTVDITTSVPYYEGYGTLDALVSVTESIDGSYLKGTEILYDGVAVSDSATAFIPLTVNTDVDVTSQVTPFIPDETSSATVSATTSVAGSYTTAYTSLFDTVTVSDWVQESKFASEGATVDVTSSVPYYVGTSNIALSATVDVTSSIEAQSRVYQASATADVASSSSLLGEKLTSSLTVSDTISVTSDTFQKDTGLNAWLLNPATTGVSYYDNFDYESCAQPKNGKVLLARSDGLYLMTGETDSGELIDAEVSYGFSDLGTKEKKCCFAFYADYVSNGTLDLKVSTYDNAQGSVSYTLPVRPMASPRANRVELARGVISRHWKFTIKNHAGAGFSVTETAVDMAVSPRRV